MEINRLIPRTETPTKKESTGKQRTVPLTSPPHQIPQTANLCKNKISVAQGVGPLTVYLEIHILDCTTTPPKINSRLNILRLLVSKDSSKLRLILTTEILGLKPARLEHHG